MGSWPTPKYDLLQVLQQEVNSGRSPSLYGRTAELKSTPEREVKTVGSSVIINGEEWFFINNPPKKPDVYRVMSANTKAPIHYSFYQGNTWMGTHGNPRQASTEKEPSGLMAQGYYKYWSPIPTSGTKPAASTFDPVSESLKERNPLGQIYPLSKVPNREGVYELPILKSVGGGHHYSLFKDGHWHFTTGCISSAALAISRTQSVTTATYIGWRPLRNPHPVLAPSDPTAWKPFSEIPSESKVYELRRDTRLSSTVYSYFKDGTWMAFSSNINRALQEQNKSDVVLSGYFSGWREVQP